LLLRLAFQNGVALSAVFPETPFLNGVILSEGEPVHLGPSVDSLEPQSKDPTTSSQKILQRITTFSPQKPALRLSLSAKS
jgi:hypothetical protein